MKTVDRLDVYMGSRKVGTMAPYKKYMTVFEYSQEWLESGFSISPFSLPLTPEVKISKPDPFDGLFGIFADSLPDGWGRLLVDRMLRQAGEKPEEIDSLTRLSIVGASGMGALEYRPAQMETAVYANSDLDYLSEECRKLLTSKGSSDLDALFSLGGSSGGARPKVLIRLYGREWIVKFPSSEDPDDIGKQEFDYNVCAMDCGIDIPDFKLFPSEKGPGYFGVERFDRVRNTSGKEKIHMASASALLEISHRVPSLDYTSLMSLTWQLTKKSAELLKMYRLMCFNVFAHNRDDHSNNFSFLCRDGEWTLAPAYDLTYSNSIGGEHATTVAGEGKSPSVEHLLIVAKKAGIKESQASEIVIEIQEKVREHLGKYLFGKKSVKKV